MKKLLAAMLAFIIILSGNIAVFATAATPRNTKTTIKVGYLQNYGIIQTPLVQGAEGYGYEYLQKLEEYTNYEFEYVPLSWIEGLAQLKAGKIDILAPASISEARKQDYDFVESLFLHEETNIYALEKSPYHYGEPKQLQGKTVGVMKGSVYEEQFAAYAQKHDITCNVVYIAPEDAADQLEDGGIDLYVDGTLFLREKVQSIEKLHAENLYLMVKKGDDSLNYLLNSAMLALEADDPYYNELLWYKYYAQAPKANQKLTAGEVASLQSKDGYTVGYHADLQPLSYTGTNGEPRGYAIGVMNILAEELSIAIEYVPLHDEADNSAQALDFNLCPLRDGCETCGTLSEPYDRQALIVVKDKGLADSDVKDILVRDYATIQIDDFLVQYPQVTVHKSYSSTQSMQVSRAEDINCIIIPESSEMAIYEANNTTVRVLDVTVPMCITVAEGLPKGVYTALNKEILSLKKSTVEELALESVVELQGMPTFWDMVVRYQAPIFGVFLLVILVFFYVQRKNQKETKRLLEVDTLTGVMTQYKFQEAATKLLQGAKPHQYMLVMLDVDKFKTINKTYGTEMGDKLLVLIAQGIKRRIQKGAIVGRLQSDTFVVLTKANGAFEDAVGANFKDDAYEKTLEQTGLDMAVYFSFGVYVVENTADDISFIIDNARTAKGYGKTTFGDTVSYFTKELQAKHEKESSILSSMEAALEEEEFFILVQPKIELQTNRLVGGEALVRWRKKDGTFIYPDEFIPLLEENKFIIQLDRYVLEKTCAYIRDSALTLPVLSVNVSAITMLEPEFISYGLDVLQKYGVSPQQIQIELTESVLDSDYNYISNVISSLKKVGFCIAIDDFGKGASSLARIKEVEMDVLKLDREFIEDNAENEKGKLVLSNVISMANDLGIICLAEGIETKQQQELLVQFGCEQGQGYLFDKPLSTSEFTQRVQANSKLVHAPVPRYQKEYRFWNESQDFSYGMAVIKNDNYATIIQANNLFYSMIGYTKDSFEQKHHSRFVAVLVDNLSNLIYKYITDKKYSFSFEIRLLTGSGEIVWVHEMIKFDPVDQLFFVTLIPIADQSYLKDSAIAHNNMLQQSNQIAVQLQKELHKVLTHYQADRAYLVQYSQDDLIASGYQEVLQEGVASHRQHFETMQHGLIQALAHALKKLNSVYVDVAALHRTKAHQPLVQILQTADINTVAYAVVKDVDDRFMGFVAIDNPKQQLDSLHMLENQASCMAAYLVQNQIKTLEKQVHLQEERSKAEIINLCINMLRTTTAQTTAKTTTTALELLLKHYEGKACVIVQLDPEQKTYKIRYMNAELNAYPALAAVEQLPYHMVEQVIEAFERTKYALLECSTEDFFTGDDRSKWAMFGIEKAYFAPMFDRTNKCDGMLVITNPALGERSPMLVQVVAKFLSDYQAKYDIYFDQKSKVSIEPLTGLLNKIATGEKIEELLQSGKNGALYMIDIDNFKQINDKLGHAVGDKVIVEIARELQKIFRRDDIIGRIGGDEFILFASDLTAEEIIARKAAEIVSALAKTYQKDGVSVQTSASVGICVSDDGKDTFQYLYQEADKALYRAKQHGKNQYYF